MLPIASYLLVVSYAIGLHTRGSLPGGSLSRGSRAVFVESRRMSAHGSIIFR